VCRGWREAGSLQQDDEHLELLLDLDNLIKAHLATSLAWLQRHGSCVTGLSISSKLKPCWSVMQQLVVSPVTIGNQLTRLELLGEDTLLPLVPHLPRLVGLKHLKACITGTTYGATQVLASFRRHDFKSNSQVPEVLGLGQVCPGLTGLHLTVNGWGPSFEVTTVDERVMQLLPANLQELHLESPYLAINCSHVTHVTGLTRLTLQAPRILRPR
jgi:hypothetical protein